MGTTLIEIRRAKPAEAEAVASTHDAAWRTCYRGMILGPEREKLVRGRGQGGRETAVGKGSGAALLQVADLAQSDPLILAALEGARVLVRDLARERVRLRIGLGVDLADMAHPAGAEPRHDQHAAG